MIVRFDKNRNIKNFTPAKIFATEKKASRLNIYADFDIADKEASILLRRADGVILGPYATYPGIDEQEQNYFYYDFDNKEDLAVVGPLEITVRFTIYRYDETMDEIMPVQLSPCAMITTYVYNAVGVGTPDIENYEVLYRQMRDLQIAFNQYRIIVDETEPVDKKKGILWMQIKGEYEFEEET